MSASSSRRLAASAPRPARQPRAGFSLIELLIVVVIIGILAMIAIPAFANTKGKANLAKVKSDLRSLAAIQEGYFYDHGTYAPGIAALGSQASPGVTITLHAPLGSASGWSATATHPGAAPNTCSVFYGAAAPVAPATVEGVVACQ